MCNEENFTGGMGECIDAFESNYKTSKLVDESEAIGRRLAPLPD